MESALCNKFSDQLVDDRLLVRPRDHQGGDLSHQVGLQSKLGGLHLQGRLFCFIGGQFGLLQKLLDVQERMQIL